MARSKTIQKSKIYGDKYVARVYERDSGEYTIKINNKGVIGGCVEFIEAGPVVDILLSKNSGMASYAKMALGRTDVAIGAEIFWDMHKRDTILRLLDMMCDHFYAEDAKVGKKPFDTKFGIEYVRWADSAELFKRIRQDLGSAPHREHAIPLTLQKRN